MHVSTWSPPFDACEHTDTHMHTQTDTRSHAQTDTHTQIALPANHRVLVRACPSIPLAGTRLQPPLELAPKDYGTLGH